MVQKPICGLGQKWPNPAFFAISAAVAQVVHALCPKRFIWSQVTQKTSFREKIFFNSPSEKKFLRLKISKIWGSDHYSTPENGG